MGPILVLIAGLVGAGLMYLLDPDQGKRRRELLRDQATSKVKDMGDTLQSKVQHTRNMAVGVVAETKSHLEQDKDKEDKREAIPIFER